MNQSVIDDIVKKLKIEKKCSSRFRYVKRR